MTRATLSRGLARHMRDHSRVAALVSALFNVAWHLLGMIKGVKMAVDGAQQKISHEVGQWADVTIAPHRFGGVEYQLGKREIGHIHGDVLVDIPFPKPVRNELVAAGRVQPHHILPDSGWISFYIRTPEDVVHAIELLQRSYQIASQQVAARHLKNEAYHETERPKPQPAP